MPRFSQTPTLGELIRRAVALWVQPPKDAGVVGPRGLARIRYLKRGDTLVDLPDLRDDDRLTRNTAWHLCRRLGIPLEDFGLDAE